MPRWTVWQTMLACGAVCSATYVVGVLLDLPEWWRVCSQVVLGVGVAWWGTQPVGG